MRSARWPLVVMLPLVPLVPLVPHFAAGCGGSSTSDVGADGSAGTGSAGVAGTGAGASGAGGSAGTSGTGGSGADGPTACEEPSECTVRAVSCCGTCGAATRGDAAALHVVDVGRYEVQACGPGTGCPTCYLPQDPTLVATCAAAKCTLVDLLEHSATRCTSDAECVVRTKDCCECGGATGEEGLLAIAASQRAAFEELVCDTSVGCPECEPVYPDEARAACEGGRCSIEWSR